MTDAVLRSVLAAERPDFAAITGDVISGYWFSPTNHHMWAYQPSFPSDHLTHNLYKELYRNFTKPLTEAGVPWAYTMGNHDIEGYMTAQDIYKMDSAYNLSLTQPNAANLSRQFNYVLPLYDKTGTKIAARL